MLNLVWKDFKILNRFLWLAPIYGFCGLFAFSFAMEGAALSATTVGVTYILMDQACALDTKNISEIMLNSLPLRRRDIVFAKYLSVFLYAAVAILSFVFAQGVVSVTGIPVLGVPAPITQISWQELGGALVAMVVLISFYYPFYFKLGHQRSKWAGMTLFFFLVFFIPLAGDLIAGEFGAVHNSTLLYIIALIGRLGYWQQTQTDWQIAGYILVFALILMVASARLSLRFYTRREF